MRNVIAFVLVGLFVVSLKAQDSTSLAEGQYVEERKQRFIDRYENIFMTKEPTRHMIKAGIMPFGIFRGDIVMYDNEGSISHSLGYEFKVAPPISVGINAYERLGVTSGLGEGVKFTGSINFSGQVRWYYDMNTRIRKGLSANNFSGNYLGATYDHFYAFNRSYTQTLPRLGIEYGIQRRFMSLGFVDLAVGVYRNLPGTFTSKVQEYSGRANHTGWTIGTRATLGLAFGDWKKRKNLPDCEVLRCDEELKSQFTISWPHLSLGAFQQVLTGSIGYEQKLFPSVSAKVQIWGFLNSFEQDNWQRQTSKELVSQIQLRYYTSHRRARKKGKGGYDLNGFYLGPQLEHQSLVRNVSGHGWINSQRQDLLKIGLGLGYQHVLFKHAYVDVGSGFTVNLIKKGEINAYSNTLVRIGFGLRL